MKIQVTTLLLYRESHDGDSGFILSKYPLEECGYITIGERSVEVDIPDDFDPRQQKIELLQKEKDRISAAFAKRCSEIQEQINRLYALDLT